MEQLLQELESAENSLIDGLFRNNLGVYFAKIKLYDLRV